MSSQPPPDAPDGAPFKLVTIGHVNPNKRAASVIAAIAAHPVLRREVTYHLVGRASPETAAMLSQLARQTGVRVTLSGEVDDNTLLEAIVEADAAACLRWPPLEAASGSTIEALLYGKPAIVNDAGFYSELPDDCVVKVDPDHEVDSVMNALLRLVNDRDAARALGARARDWATATFSAENYARETVDMVETCAATIPVQKAAEYFGRVLAGWGAPTELPTIMPHLARPLEFFEGGRPPAKGSGNSTETA